MIQHCCWLRLNDDNELQAEDRNIQGSQNWPGKDNETTVSRSDKRAYFNHKNTMTNKENIQVNWATITYFPDSHRYKDADGYIPSVSTIANTINKGDWLMYWALKLAQNYLIGLPAEKRTDDEVINAIWQHKAVKNDACLIWNIVHEYAEKIIKKEEFDFEVVKQLWAWNWISAFQDWAKEQEIEWLESERCVYHRELRYVWRFDALAMLHGRKTLIDFKTSNSFDPISMPLQTAGYVLAYCEETWEIPENIDRIIVRFDKTTGEFFVHKMENHGDDFTAFVGCVALNTFKKTYGKDW